MFCRLNTRWTRHCRRHEYIRCIHWPSREVRSTFINFFKDHNHQYVRSSPVVPWNDPSLAFVNAGMNQFNSVFLGQSRRPCPRATNSQKCIRIGGKHNDLNDVGRDTYHHTFFEMLGSWSFEDYFKREACTMSWNLLTEVYKLPPEQLFVTYFGGDSSLNLEPDLETRDIWRSIGVADNRILPFGLKDNFWEMGTQGPCGPCTEIHFDRFGHSDAQKRVNMGVEDVIELWNLVFMQYERLKDGSLQALNTHHVDTGMGLERITAVLNQKMSNYDTDLFLPIFKKIEEMSGKAAYSGSFSKDGQCIDTAYRILADHLRMTTVALGDGLFPEDSYKLRSVMRRAIHVGRDIFNFTPEKKNLVELTNVVVESLGEAYPELWSRLESVQIILQEEEENLLKMQSRVSKEWGNMLKEDPSLNVFSDIISPPLLTCLKEVIPFIKKCKNNNQEFPSEMIMKIIDSYGQNIFMIEKLSNFYNLDIDIENVEREIERAREQKYLMEKQKWEESKFLKRGTKHGELVFDDLPPTDDGAKYLYEKSNGNYLFAPLESKVLSILCDGQQVNSVAGRKNIGVVLNSTNFFHEAGGQECDRGELVSEDTQMNVKYVEKIGDVIIHWGSLEFGELSTGKKLMACINTEFRFGCMQHHTATHLLDSAIRAVTGVSSQISSSVWSDHLSLGVRISQALLHNSIEEAENLVKVWVNEKCTVNRNILPVATLFKDTRATFLPGEVYPDNVHVITTSLNSDINTTRRGMVKVSSVEPCCGTHLLNTGDMENFCITAIKSTGVGLYEIKAVCGKTASIAIANAKMVLSQLEKWETTVEKNISMANPASIENTAKDLKNWHKTFGTEPMPYFVRNKMNSLVDDLARLLRNALRGDVNKQMLVEMDEVLTNQPFGPIVHFLKTDFGSKKVLLGKASKMCKHRPALVLAKSNRQIFGRATVPKEMAENGASATDWASCLQNIFQGVVKVPRHQDPQLVCNFHSPPLKSKDFEKLEDAILKLKNYIEKFV